MYVVEDATAGIAPETVESERAAMIEAGVTIITSADLPGLLASLEPTLPGGTVSDTSGSLPVHVPWASAAAFACAAFCMLAMFP